MSDFPDQTGQLIGIYASVEILYLNPNSYRTSKELRNIYNEAIRQGFKPAPSIIPEQLPPAHP